MPQKSGSSNGHRTRPQHVTDAILRGDYEALSKMGRAGGRKAKKRDRYKEQVEATARSPFYEFDLAIDASIQEQHLEDAKDHADVNRIGWDDDYRP